MSDPVGSFSFGFQVGVLFAFLVDILEAVMGCVSFKKLRLAASVSGRYSGCTEFINNIFTILLVIKNFNYVTSEKGDWIFFVAIFRRRQRERNLSNTIFFACLPLRQLKIKVNNVNKNFNSGIHVAAFFSLHFSIKFPSNLLNSRF